MQLAGYSISSDDHFDLENYHTKIGMGTWLKNIVTNIHYKAFLSYLSRQQWQVHTLYNEGIQGPLKKVVLLLLTLTLHS